MDQEYLEISQMIDHSLLRPDLTIEDVRKGLEIAVNYQVKTVCVRPCDLELAVSQLKDSSVLPTTVISFPHGADTTKQKLSQTRQLIDIGARELDIVLNINRLISGDLEYVENELQALTNIAHDDQVLVKIIFENCYLSEKEKITACQICSNVGVDFVKTSTGFGSGGAEDQDLMLMREHTDRHIRIKAAGGIRSLKRLYQVKELGCSRVGCTATISILEELKVNLGL